MAHGKIGRTPYLIIAALLIYLLALYCDLEILDDYNYAWSDRLITTFDSRPPDPHLMLISIGNDDLNALGPWPWNRERLARVVTFLHDAGARVIVFDLFFRKADSGDRALQKAIKSHGKVVFALPWDSAKGVVEKPMESYRQAGAWFGHVAVTHKNVCRMAKLFLTGPVYDPRMTLQQNIEYPALSLMAVRLFNDQEKDPIEAFDSFPGGPRLKVSRSLTVPVIRTAYDGKVAPSHMLINYSGPAGHYNNTVNSELSQQWAISEILNDKPGDYTKERQSDLRHKAKGSIVLIYNTFDPNDMFRTPYTGLARASGGEELMPGGEMHAHTIATLLEKKFIAANSTLDGAMPLFALLMGVLIFLRPISWKMRLILFSSLSCGLIILSLALFKYMHLFTGIAMPLFSLVLLYVTLIFYERKKFLSLFGDFVSHRLKDEILKDESRGSVGTREVEATIVFADIRGFSTLSEKMTPGELTTMITEYHTEMNKIFEQNSGVILDYLGDAEMVGFGILGERENHPLQAIKSGLEMQQRIGYLREKWGIVGGQVFEVGVGICTGLVAEGIVGSEGVKKQLVSMGDTTNTAARIQALSKELDSLVTISESTYVKVKDDINADALKEMPLKGKTQKVMLYRVNSIKEESLMKL